MGKEKGEIVGGINKKKTRTDRVPYCPQRGNDGFSKSEVLGDHILGLCELSVDPGNWSTDVAIHKACHVCRRKLFV